MSEDKIPRTLASVMAARPPDEKIPVIVRYRPEVALSGRAVADAAPRYRFTLLAANALRATAQQISALAADPTVERVWEDLPVRAWLDRAAPYVNVPQVWAAGVTGQGVRVAILDTGLDPDHPDFVGRVVAGEDFVGEGVRDRNGHGTHVAGIALGAGSQYRGVAPQASLYVGKVLYNDGNGSMSDVIAGLEWAVSQQVRVVNLSVGASGPGDGSDALSAACDAVVGRGVVVCVAAGNEGPASSTVGPPGCARLVITVGASTLQGDVCAFSSRGPTADGRVKPDIVLPGENIISCRAANTAMGSPINNLYTRSSGTSMASPFATGAAALLLQAKPELTPAQVKERLIKAARTLGLDPNIQGAGLTDIYAAYQGQGATVPPPGTGCLTALLGVLLRQ